MNSMLQSSINSELKALQTNPVQYILSKNLNIPSNIGNDPQTIVQHLVNSGQVSPQKVAQLRQMLGI